MEYSLGSHLILSIQSGREVSDYQERRGHRGGGITRVTRQEMIYWDAQSDKLGGS
jgi:hypothetical protein